MAENEEKGSPICERVSVMKEIIQNFLLPKPKKRVWGNFRIEENRIVYRPTDSLVWNPHEEIYE